MNGKSQILLLFTENFRLCRFSIQCLPQLLWLTVSGARNPCVSVGSMQAAMWFRRAVQCFIASTEIRTQPTFRLWKGIKLYWEFNLHCDSRFVVMWNMDCSENIFPFVKRNGAAPTSRYTSEIFWKLNVPGFCRLFRVSYRNNSKFLNVYSRIWYLFNVPPISKPKSFTDLW